MHLYVSYILSVYVKIRDPFNSLNADKLNVMFSATKRCNIVTLFRMVTIMLQHCNAVLR